MSAFEPGDSGPPYYCTPPVSVPAVIGGLTVWRLDNQKKKGGQKEKTKEGEKKRRQNKHTHKT